MIFGVLSAIALGIGVTATAQDLIEEVENCRNNSEVRQVGIEWAIAQSKELKAAGAPVLHYYSMGKSDNIKAIAKEVF